MLLKNLLKLNKKIKTKKEHKEMNYSLYIMIDTFNFFIESLAEYKSKFCKYAYLYKYAQITNDRNTMNLYFEKMHKKTFFNLMIKIKDLSPEFQNNVYNGYLDFECKFNSKLNDHSVALCDKLRKSNYLDNNIINEIELTETKLFCDDFNSDAKEKTIKIFNNFDNKNIFYLLKNTINNMSDVDRQLFQSSLEQFNNEEY
jgi:hypothetical protein